MKRALVALVAVVVALVWQTPATVADSGLGWLSAGTLRIAQAQGTLWTGRGAVMGLDSTTDGWQPWLIVEWTLNASALLRGKLSWEVTSAHVPVARTSMGFGGIEISQLRLGGPARFFLGLVPNSLGRAGWKGDIATESPRFHCSWHGLCEGHAELRWIGAASDLLPGDALGDYKLAIDGSSGNQILFQVQTIDGPIRVEGQGRWELDGPLVFDGTIKGNAGLLQRLPSVAGPWVRPSVEPGTWNVVIRQESG